MCGDNLFAILNGKTLLLWIIQIRFQRGLGDRNIVVKLRYVGLLLLFHLLHLELQAVEVVLLEHLCDFPHNEWVYLRQHGAVQILNYLINRCLRPERKFLRNNWKGELQVMRRKDPKQTIVLCRQPAQNFVCRLLNLAF